MTNRVGYGLELAGAVSSGAARSVVATARRTAGSVRELTREAAGQLPRLARLEQIQPRTRISLGLLVAERTRRSPEDTFFLFEDRAYNAREVGERIDNIVRGLISIGVRQGEHVGVLMSARPSALALVAALSRLGAVAVMLRPDGDTEREAGLAQVQRIIADPERAAQAAGLGAVHTFVLGGGGGPRDLGIELTTDMEQIDVRKVQLPRWYRPNPGRAGDLAFILFTGQRERTRMSRITNRRWVMSAFGTASSAALSSADTVYSVTPLYHPSGLMMSVGGAIAGGARLAMATAFEPSRFWEEVRRYGVTVASYTWSLLHDLVHAPPTPSERHHPVRLFIGSGMPRGLWRRVERRFAPARVLEFYASTETGVILVNLRGVKPGAMGRPLPGSAEVRLAAYNVEAEQLVLGRDGFVRPCKTGEVGMLLARTSATAGVGTLALRGVFSRDDAWLATGDLFRRDDEGDYWRLDSLNDVIADVQRAGLHRADPRRAGRSSRGRPRRRIRDPRQGRCGAGRRRGHARTTRDDRCRRRDRCAERVGSRSAADARPRRRRDPCHDLVSTDHDDVARSGRPHGRRKLGPCFYRGPRSQSYKPLTDADRRRLAASEPAAKRRWTGQPLRQGWVSVAVSVGRLEYVNVCE